MGNQYEITVVIQISMETWLEAARAGCPDSLGMALESCRSDLHRIARDVLPLDLWSKADVSDLVQETFFEASRDFAGFSGRTGAEWRAWLRQIFHNNLQHMVRHYRQTAKRCVDQEVSLHEMEAWGFALGGLAADDGSSPCMHAMRNEQRELVARAMAELSERDRRVLVMKFQERRTLEEIGQELGCTPAGARKASLKALERLRIELDLSSMVR